VLKAVKPTMTASSNGRLLHLPVNMAKGMAAINEPMAYNVTSCPAMPLEICNPSLICGSKPAEYSLLVKHFWID